MSSTFALPLCFAADRDRSACLASHQVPRCCKVSSIQTPPWSRKFNPWMHCPSLHTASVTQGQEVIFDYWRRIAWKRTCESELGTSLDNDQKSQEKKCEKPALWTIIQFTICPQALKQNQFNPLITLTFTEVIFCFKKINLGHLYFRAISSTITAYNLLLNGTLQFYIVF